MSQTNKASFLIMVALIFLLPIFFASNLLNLESAKSSIFSFGILAALAALVWDSWKRKEISIPKHWLGYSALLLPAVYLISAISQIPNSMSLFGYSFEVGTFGYMAFGALALIISSIIFSDASKILNAYTAFFASFSLLAVFVFIKVVTGGSPEWGSFAGAMGNMLGRWTDLGMAFGLLAVFAALAIGVLPMKKGPRAVSYAVFFLSLILLVVVNFSTALWFVLASSIVLYAYFSTIEKHFMNLSQQNSSGNGGQGFFSKPVFLPIVLGAVSLAFLINPTITGSGDTLADAVSRMSGVSNADVRPSFSATLGVSRAALSGGPLLGSGPNSWSQDWLAHKPIGVNATPFWGIAFPFGIGFIPTQVSATGIIGTLAWVTFFVSLVTLGRKSITSMPESRTLRFVLVFSLLSVFYLWASSFFYAPSFAMLSLTFILTGILLSAQALAGAIPMRTISLSRDASTNFGAILLFVLVGFGALALGTVAFKKTVSAYNFNKAVTIANSESPDLARVEELLNKAAASSPADIHYSALSEVNFAQAQAVAARTEGDQAQNMEEFQREMSASIQAARQATAINPGGYRNWLILGAVYGSLVPPPLSVSGAYENSIAAYTEASRRNPSSPEVPLLVARLEAARGSVETARTLGRQAVWLKEDYAPAYVFLAQLELAAGNIGGAIASAERLGALLPNNPAVHFELGLLKYSATDYQGALAALSQALSVTPDYANALYYRGLTLARLGMTEDAVADFEALSESNPDNEEVLNILGRLRAGQSIFSN